MGWMVGAEPEVVGSETGAFLLGDADLTLADVTVDWLGSEAAAGVVDVGSGLGLATGSGSLLTSATGSSLADFFN